jgi:steroid 5-alpha reductase family enzyme
MFQSFEMNNHEQQQRHDAMRAHIDHGRLRRGKLKPREDDRYVAMLNHMETTQPFHLLMQLMELQFQHLLQRLSR